MDNLIISVALKSMYCGDNTTIDVKTHGYYLCMPLFVYTLMVNAYFRLAHKKRNALLCSGTRRIRKFRNMSRPIYHSLDTY